MVRSMTGGGRRDVEADLRQRLARDAQIGVASLRRSHGTPETVIDYLVSRAYGSPDRLLDARDRLGEPDSEARALLLRASRRAADPVPEPLPQPLKPLDAGRYSSGGYAPAPGGVTTEGGAQSGDQPAPPT